MTKPRQVQGLATLECLKVRFKVRADTKAKNKELGNVRVYKRQSCEQPLSLKKVILL